MLRPATTSNAARFWPEIDESVWQPQVNRLAASLEQARAQAALSAAEYRRAAAVESAGALSAEEIEKRRAASVTDAANVKVADAMLAEAQARLTRTRVVAPTDGTVLTRRAEVGQTASPGGDALFRLASGGEIEMRGQVAEQDMALLTVGQTGGRLSGRLATAVRGQGPTARRGDRSAVAPRRHPHCTETRPGPAARRICARLGVCEQGRASHPSADGSAVGYEGPLRLCRERRRPCRAARCAGGRHHPGGHHHHRRFDGSGADRDHRRRLPARG